MLKEKEKKVAKSGEVAGGANAKVFFSSDIQYVSKVRLFKFFSKF